MIKLALKEILITLVEEKIGFFNKKFYSKITFTYGGDYEVIQKFLYDLKSDFKIIELSIDIYENSNDDINYIEFSIITTNYEKSLKTFIKLIDLLKNKNGVKLIL